MRNIRWWFWVEAWTAALAGGLGVLTLVWPRWIEAVFGVDPDRGSGSAELWVVGVLVAVGLVTGLAARRALTQARAWGRSQSS